MSLLEVPQVDVGYISDGALTPLEKVVPSLFPPEEVGVATEEIETIEDTMTRNMPSTMRVAQWTTNTGGLEKNLKVNSDAPLPKDASSLPNGHTLVKVAYASLNPIDYKVAELPIVGNYVLAKPSIPCLDFSGTVVSTSHPDLKSGDLVHGRTDPPKFSCAAEYITVSQNGISKIPSRVSLRDAATAGIAALAAYQCIAPFVKEDDTVFINGGSGGTGTYGIQIAKALGCRVIVSCSGKNAALCKSLGADLVINYKEKDIFDALIEDRKQHGRINLVVDNVWTDASLYWKCHEFVIHGGHYVTPGGTRLNQLKDIFLSNVWPSYLFGGQRGFKFVACQPKERDLKQIDEWMASGKVKAVVEKEFKMEEAGKAFERLKTGRVVGKVVVKVASD